MKIQIFEVIKQGISLSFKDKTVLSLIILNPILIIVFIFLATTLINSVILESKGFIVHPLASFIFSISIGLFIFALFTIFIVIFYAIAKAVFENLNKREIFISDAIIFALKKFISIFVASIIFFIIVVSGWVFLMIPGIFLFVTLSFFSHAILLNNKGMIDSFKESWNIIKGNWWQVFTILFIIFLIYIITAIVVSWFRFYILILPLHLLINIISAIILYSILGVAMVIYTIVYFQLTEKEKKIEEKIESIKVVQEKRKE